MEIYVKQNEAISITPMGKKLDIEVKAYPVLHKMRH